MNIEELNKIFSEFDNEAFAWDITTHNFSTTKVSTYYLKQNSNYKVKFTLYYKKSEPLIKYLEIKAKLPRNSQVGLDNFIHNMIDLEFIKNSRLSYMKIKSVKHEILVNETKYKLSLIFGPFKPFKEI